MRTSAFACRPPARVKKENGRSQSDKLPPRLCDWAAGMELPRRWNPGNLRVEVYSRPEPGMRRSRAVARVEHSFRRQSGLARARFVRPRDGRRFTVCRGSLRLILAQLTGAPAQDVAFRFGAGGKPELAGAGLASDASVPRFNVSHSDDLALIAVSSRSGARRRPGAAEDHFRSAADRRVVFHSCRAGPVRRAR